jgi:hypothetical protein
VRYAFLQLVRPANGGLLAMGGRAAIYDSEVGSTKTGRRGSGPSRWLVDGRPTETLVLWSTDGLGRSWEDITADFPAGITPPPGLDDPMMMWDADGDRIGRHLCALADGRVVLTWGLAHDPNGLNYNVRLHPAVVPREAV